MACTPSLLGRARPSPPSSAFQRAPVPANLTASDHGHPTSTQLLQTAARSELLLRLVVAGTRMHQSCARHLEHGSSAKEMTRSPCERAAARLFGSTCQAARSAAEAVSQWWREGVKSHGLTGCASSGKKFTRAMWPRRARWAKPSSHPVKPSCRTRHPKWSKSGMQPFF